MQSMLFCSRHCENVSLYLTEQPQWLRSCCSIEENGSKIAYFSGSTHTAHGAPPALIAQCAVC